MTANAAALRNRLKLRHLVLLAELEVSGSLHKTAERLGMSQPAATRLVRELEGLMDAALFERSSRGMRPTDMGRLMMRHATMLLTGVDQIHQEAVALRSGAAGRRPAPVRKRSPLNCPTPSASPWYAVPSKRCLRRATPLKHWSAFPGSCPRATRLGRMRTLVPLLQTLDAPAGVTRRIGEAASGSTQRFVKALHRACSSLAAGDPESGSPTPNN